MFTLRVRQCVGVTTYDVDIAIFFASAMLPHLALADRTCRARHAEGPTRQQPSPRDRYLDRPADYVPTAGYHLN